MNRHQRERIRGARRASTAGLCTCALLVALLLGSSASANDDGSLGAAKEGGLGFAAAISSLVYGPVKVVYATGGTVMSGFAWAFSGGDSEVASTVLTRSVRGTYVITPSTIRGEEQLEFIGREPSYRAEAPQRGNAVASAPEAW